MTSTPFNVGLGDGQRMSSRVLRPPGGGHTDIFGGEPEPPRGRRAVPPPMVQEDRSERIDRVPLVEAPQNGQSCPEPSPQMPEIPEPVKSDDHPGPVSKTNDADAPKRVRVPPGGFSSGFW